MIEEFKYTGVWWLPNKPEEQICGTLRFAHGEGAILDLIGSFKDMKIHRSFKSEIILGMSSNGRKITLWKCFETKSNFSWPGFSTSSLYAEFVFVGAHFQKPDETEFKSVSVHYSHLDEWINISGFDIEFAPKEKEVIIKYKLPEPFQADIGDGIRITVNFRATPPPLSLVQTEAFIKQRTEIKIETSKDRRFEDYRRIISHIQDFLTLGISQPVHPLAIEGIPEVNEEMIDDNPYPVQIFYRLPDISKAAKTLLPSDMLFSFKDISNRFQVILKNWFTNVELLEPVFSLYFGTLYNPRMYLEHQFLSLIQAAESFHQRIYGGQYCSDEDYDKIYQILVKAIPQDAKRDLKESLENRLKYGNEFSLRRRLKEILGKYHRILSRFIENKDAFVQRVVDTRNYLTHYDEDLKKRAASGTELYRLTQKLHLLLRTCLLAQVGFSSAEIEGLLARKCEISA